MHAFTDNAGRTWTVAINVAVVKRIRALLQVDLYRLVEDGFEPLAKLLADPVQLADVLFCLCKDEADAKGITDEDFGRALAGDAITLAAESFTDELIAFFPDARTRTGLKQVVVKGRKVRDRLLDHLGMLVERIDPEREASGLIASFGALPASSGSTPDRSLSPNS